MRFVEILTYATLVTGLIWLLDILILKPRRAKKAGLSLEGEVPVPWWVDYARAFFPVLLIVLIIRSFIIEPFRIPSGSMRPTLVEGDFIVVNKYDYGLRLPFSGKKFVTVGEPRRGDVIVFKHEKNGESLDLIKRVVGLPGDHIEYKNKRLHVNGAPVKLESLEDKIDREPSGVLAWPVRHQIETLDDIQHDIYVQTQPSRSLDRFTDVIVPQNSYFVLGDNRDNSGDSRAWGFVKDEDILGRAMLIWFSWDSTKMSWDCLNECIRFNRIGKGLSNKMDNQKLAWHSYGQ